MKAKFVFFIGLIGLFLLVMNLISGYGLELIKTSEGLSYVINQFQYEMILLGIRSKSDDLLWHRSAWHEYLSNGVSLERFIRLMYPAVDLETQTITEIYFVYLNDLLFTRSTNEPMILPFLREDVLYRDYYFDGQFYWNQILLEDPYTGCNAKILYALNLEEFYPKAINTLYKKTIGLLENLNTVSRSLYFMANIFLAVSVMGGFGILIKTRKGR